MKCQILFSGKNKKNISKCRLLKILPRVLSVNINLANKTSSLYDQNFGHTAWMHRLILVKYLHYKLTVFTNDAITCKTKDIRPIYPVTTLWANSADDKLTIFFLFSPENRFCNFMQIVSIGDILYEMSKPVFWEKNTKYFKMLSAESINDMFL